MSRKTRHAESAEPVALGFHDDIKKIAKKNLAFREAVCTGAFSELVVMSISPMGELGQETHDNADEILFIIEGKGELILNGQTQAANKHDAIFVSAGEIHDLRNTGHDEMKLVAVYSPPPSGRDTTIHKTGAKAAEEQLRHAWEQ